MTLFNRVVATLLLLALIPIITVGLIAPRDGVQLLSDVLDEIESQLDPSPSALEMLVRAYDPCISCSAHYLKVEFKDE